MDWARLDLRMSGKAVASDADCEIVRQVAEHAILSSDRDPEIVLAAAANALGRAGFVDDLREYVTCSIFRALKRKVSRQAKREATALAGLDSNISFQDNLRIENAILLREILDKLAPTDKEIFTLRLNGETFPEIDVLLRLRPRTAESRFRICSNEIRNAKATKLDTGTTFSGG